MAGAIIRTGFFLVGPKTHPTHFGRFKLVRRDLINPFYRRRIHPVGSLRRRKSAPESGYRYSGFVGLPVAGLNYIRVLTLLFEQRVRRI